MSRLDLLALSVTPAIDPASAPDGRQLDNIRAELHAIVDRCVGDWPTIRRQSREMGRGFAGGGGAGSGSSAGDPTGGVATSGGPDPAAGHLEWLNGFRVLVVSAYALEGQRVKLVGAGVGSNESRPPASELCPECGVVVSKGKRLDGALYHNGGNDPACFWAAYDRLRGRRGPGAQRGTATYGGHDRDRSETTGTEPA